LDLSPLQIDRSKSAPAARRGRGGRTNWFAWGVLAAAALLLFFFRRPLLEIADRLRLPEVEVAVATKSSPLAAGAIEGTAANGYVVADRRAALSADTPGRIVELNVREGSVVKKGDVVARLYADEYRAALARAEADVAAQRATVERTALDLKVAEAEVSHQASVAAAAAAGVDDADAAEKLAKLKYERAVKLVDDKIETQQTLDDARAEHDRAVASLATARAMRDAAQAEAKQVEARVASATSAVSEAEARLPSLEAGRDLAKATLDKTEVRAPFAGVVIMKDAEVGEVVSPNAQGTQSRGSVATMIDFASLQVQVEMPERNINAVSIGAPTRIFLDADPDHPYTGSVERVFPTASRQKATIEVRVRFDQLDERLRPDMGARVVFLPPEMRGSKGDAAVGGEAAPQGVFVPANCLVKIDGKSGVFVVDRDVARFHPIAGGEARSGKVLVQSGLEGGEKLVVQPPSSLSDGDRVRVKE
jgi:HlyD family secretion protein